MKKVQTIMSKAMVPVFNMVSGIGDSTLKDTLLQDYLTPLTDMMRLGFAAFSLLDHSCRDVIQNDMKYPTNKLCHSKHPIGQEDLFGDVPKMVKEMKEQSEHMKFTGDFSGQGLGSLNPPTTWLLALPMVETFIRSTLQNPAPGVHETKVCRRWLQEVPQEE